MPENRFRMLFLGFQNWPCGLSLHRQLVRSPQSGVGRGLRCPSRGNPPVPRRKPRDPDYWECLGKREGPVGHPIIWGRLVRILGSARISWSSSCPGTVLSVDLRGHRSIDMVLIRDARCGLECNHPILSSSCIQSG